MLVTCAHCGKTSEKPTGDVNRADRAGAPKYCDRVCAGLARRNDRTAAERKAIKADYDRARRERLADQIKAAKAAHHKRTYDPEKAKALRLATAAQIAAYKVAYMADPENRRAKHEYDIARAAGSYGEWADAWRLLLELEREIVRLVPDRYERAKGRRGHYWMNRRQRGELRT